MQWLALRRHSKTIPCSSPGCVELVFSPVSSHRIVVWGVSKLLYNLQSYELGLQSRARRWNSIQLYLYRTKYNTVTSRHFYRETRQIHASKYQWPCEEDGCRVGLRGFLLFQLRWRDWRREIGRMNEVCESALIHWLQTDQDWRLQPGTRWMDGYLTLQSDQRRLPVRIVMFPKQY